MPRPKAIKSQSSAKDMPAIRAAIYVRVSTDEQALYGYGLEVQRERCRAMLTVKGWTFAGEFADEGKSGTKGADGRPGLATLLAAVEVGEVDAVVVLALDRLGRKTNIVLTLVEELATYGAILVSCKESLDTSTPQGQFVLTMFAALAQLERDMIVQRTTDGRNERGKKDGEKGGGVPYGYERADEQVRVVPQAVPVIKQIFRLRYRRRLSMQAICDQLDAPPPRGARWRPSSIAAILDNEAAYRGGPRGESAVCWPRIL